MQTNLTRISAISALLSLALLAGCGDDEGGTPPDAAVPDAS
jgi:hypothetical protein